MLSREPFDFRCPLVEQRLVLNAHQVVKQRKPPSKAACRAWSASERIVSIQFPSGRYRMAASGAGASEGGRRRRHWSDGDKARIVAECGAPGSSVSLMARRHDLNTNDAVHLAASVSGEAARRK
jgi:hypothetical protein